MSSDVVSESVAKILRCGNSAIQEAILLLQRHLISDDPSAYQDNQDNSDIPRCACFALDFYHATQNPNFRFEGDYIQCRHGKNLISSIMPCEHGRTRPSKQTYMIGNRDRMRIRCRECHGVVYPLE